MAGRARCVRGAHAVAARAQGLASRRRARGGGGRRRRGRQPTRTGGARLHPRGGGHRARAAGALLAAGAGAAARGVGRRRLGRPGRRLEAAAGRLAGGIVVSVRTVRGGGARERAGSGRAERRRALVARPPAAFASRAGRATGSTRGSRTSAAARCGSSPGTGRAIACCGGTWRRLRRRGCRARASGSRTPTGQDARSSSTRTPAASSRTRPAPAPDATIRQRGAASEVVAGGRVVFRGTGEFRDVARSPDGRWLLVTWPTADQWVFVRTAGQRKIEAVSGITRQFGGGSFPRIAGWCCA